jgi:hypothetical protein
MRNAIQVFGLAALVAASTSCGDVVRDGKSPVLLVIDSLTAAAGASTTFGTNLFSDVQTIVTTGGVCSITNPCPTVFADNGRVALRIVPKDVVGLASPTTNNEVTITRYHVKYTRADGRNTQGVDVPYEFDGVVTVTVPVGQGASVGFELVRHTAKEEPPLVQLITSRTIITSLVEVTFYGKDRVGNDVSVTGSILVEFGNFGDPA